MTTIGPTISTPIGHLIGTAIGTSIDTTICPTIGITIGPTNCDRYRYNYWSQATPLLVPALNLALSSRSAMFN